MSSLRVLLRAVILPSLVALGDDADGVGAIDVLSQVKANPGNVSLDSMLAEIDKLTAVRAVGLPADLFIDVTPAVVATWRGGRRSSRQATFATISSERDSPCSPRCSSCANGRSPTRWSSC